ncbi:transcriptional accessory protein [Terriglobus roseus DSM 18391]|uniref:Transcriptional accessory protein n=1 Tax=Terriglobus roseus (strain DSM 18391 / NRRL B-41598 / KBS 63) TaxID=926566 RepID=I3ZE58_TERRK|nr:Tex family protein [Terriglobus roseus]AFL87526.1 transcriptional accessory protein [Terriglobus roseus DSM 18391]
MSVPISLDAPYLLHIAQLLNLPLPGIRAVIALSDEGSTVPFIARYRKEATGNLDEVQIRDIAEKVDYFRELLQRRETILASITEQGKLTDDLKARILATMDRSELEDLYLPYKPKRRTKATIAREKGLEPLADYLWNQSPAALDLIALAQSLVDPVKEVATIEDALEGARHIVAERISEDAEVRKATRHLMFEEGFIISRKSFDAVDEQEKFKMYYDYREPVKTIPSHRMLAVRRGESENVLYWMIELEEPRVLGLMRSRIHKADGDWTPHLNQAVEDCWKRLLNSSIQVEIRIELKRRSDAAAIDVFRDNLENLLLAAPAGPIGVLGVDPGLRTGCKLAVVNETGKFLADDVIYPHTGRTKEATDKLAALIAKHNIRAIAIGNGTASRETDAFLRDFLKEKGLANIFRVTVSEAGASVYSASDVARQEFPNLDLTVRGAISIARRLQDPLAELVKVDPKSIGVGQYQHDVDQRQLQQSLEAAIESCVNRVGVDLNTASWTLLRYVSGVTERVALNIVSFRDERGQFRSRSQLHEVPGIGPKTFEQAAGFLRVRDGDQPLDNTAVHPESYGLVEEIAKSLSAPVSDLIRAPHLLSGVKQSSFAAGTFTWNDIVEELKKPGRDPRDTFVAPTFNEAVRDLADVVPGMVLEGVVSNVTKFGAFVDVGVHQDGLVHISEISNRFIKDASEVLKAGQIVKVKVLSADIKTKRIALSIKALQAPSTPTVKNRPVKETKAIPVSDQLAALSSKWRTR